ncbi:hypothetical protein HBN50_11285 [Halobacteriovorax sp. GB3]|uniref:tetratricopeptide repeat protein n=1 Tax=Halobacteriovorax sp. GB3 TaxID=2719615 RepID=UPI00235FD68B|nr:hypothetical protein [Halobacteriovorax sp. GB3]MDD0853683.1 hypothetical protein [Halobacteriovorax sp. GB3]
MKSMMNLFLMTMIAALFTSCGAVDFMEQRAAYYNRLEDKSYALLKENEQLKIETARLKSKVKTLESKNYYLEGQIQSLKKGITEERPGRGLASVKMVDSNDMVKFDIYKWKPEEILAVADKEFNMKNFEKSAQFYNTFAIKYPSSKSKDDHFLFQAGVASYESGKHYEWTLKHLQTLVKNYPTSQYYLGAKLWIGLTYLKLGDEKNFFGTVEEFRKKYRNTPEWQILSPHYEKIVQKYKSN